MKKSLQLASGVIAFIIFSISLTQLEAQNACSATGTILQQKWDKMDGTSISDLTGNSNFPTNPTSSQQLTSFEIASGTGDQYGIKVSGYICAPKSGEYTFWIAGDDNCQLWLSTDSSDANISKIAEVTDWTNSRQWNKEGYQKSEPIYLTAGQSYYIEALMKEGGGGDNMAVGWAKPGESTVIPSEVIPGSVLSPALPAGVVAVSEILLNTNSITIVTSESTYIDAKVLPNNASNKAVSWSTSDSSVATVNSDGLITSLSEGIAIITATTINGNKTATCSVNVTKREASTVSIILDTDMGPDCDDAVALAILHVMANKGEANILAIGSCISNLNSAPTIDAINTYYGRPDIPIGALKGPFFLEDTYVWIRNIAKNFPNDLKSGANAPDAIDVYRKTLAQQPDHSVTFVSVGPMRNLNNLLKSGADEYSALNGKDLVALKVAKLVTMGGDYPSGKEWNFYQDGASSSYVVSNWPTPITFSGGAVGGACNSGRGICTKLDIANPVRTAYKDYNSCNGRDSWDPSAMLYAVRGLRTSFTAITGGTAVVAPDGSNTWKKDGNMSYLIKNSCEALADPIDELLYAPLPYVEVTSLTISTKTDTIAVGSTKKLSITVLPENATNRAVSWSSENTAIATVSTTGIVTAKAEGSTTITVTTADGSITATCAVYVGNTVGISDNYTNTLVSIYPNPANDIVTIDLGNNSEYAQVKVHIVDSLGKQVELSNIISHSSGIQINTSQFSKGIYIVNITKGTEKIIKKLVIQ